MDICRFVKVICLLFIVALQVTLGAPKCSGRWAIHSCGGGNGKRSEIDLINEEVSRTDDDRRVLPGFDSPDLTVIGNRRTDENSNEAAEKVNYYGSKRENNMEIMSPREEEEAEEEEELGDYDERLERAWQTLVRRLLKSKMDGYDG